MPLSTLGEATFLLLSFFDEVGVIAFQMAGALTNPVRRRVLALLADEKAAERDALAETLAGEEAVDADDAERIALNLHHRHLPKLDEEQLVDYDPRTGDVALWEDPTDVRSMLESK